MIRREANPAETRLVSVSWAELPGDPEVVAERIRTIVLSWVQKRTDEVLPESAARGESFTLALGNGEALAQDDWWALRFDTADEYAKDNFGIERRWRTEVAAVKHVRSALFSTRLSVVSSRPLVPFAVTAPALVSDVAKTLPFHVDGVPTTGKPIYVTDDQGFQSLLRLLMSGDRRPVICIGLTEDNKPPSYATNLSSRLLGYGHVFLLDPKNCWRMTRTVGKPFSVFGGAMRIFRTKLDPDSQDPRIHQLILPPRLEAADGSSGVIRRVVESAITHSTQRSDIDECAPSFQAIESFLTGARISTATRRAEESARRVAAAESIRDQVVALQEQISNLQDERADSLKQISALAEVQSHLKEERDFAYTSAAELEDELRRLKAQLISVGHVLRSREAELRNAGVLLANDPTPPNSWDELAEQAESVFAGRVTILPRAIKLAKKSVFDDVRTIWDCLRFLAGAYTDMRRGVAGAKDQYDQQCMDLGVEVSGVGSAIDTRRFRDQFRVQYGDHVEELDLHLAPRHGTAARGSRDPKRTFRIYFFWDEDVEQVIVGSMPEHLDTSLTD